METKACSLQEGGSQHHRLSTVAHSEMPRASLTVGRLQHGAWLFHFETLVIDRRPHLVGLKLGLLHVLHVW